MQKLCFFLLRLPKIQLILLLCFVFVCSTGCTLWGDTPGKPVQKSKGIATPAGIRLGSQACPAAMSNADGWKGVLMLGSDQRVEHVLCGNLLGISALQAVVMVRHTGSDNVLDIFVYNGAPAEQPKSLFGLKGLLHGDARISNYNTLLTAEEDRNSLYNKGLTNQWTADLGREFKWSDSAGTMVQVGFPGIFPDVTRYQAEFEQDEVNSAQGFQQWRLSAITTTQRFCERLLKWPSDTPVQVISGGGDADIHATVQVKQPSTNPVTIKLDRLERNANGGLWEVIDAQTEGVTLTVPSNEQALTSPIKVSGNATISTGTTGNVQVLDHVYNRSGESQVWSAGDAGKKTFGTPVPYMLSFRGGMQEGVVVLVVSSAIHNDVVGIGVTKVLLSA